MIFHYFCKIFFPRSEGPPLRAFFVFFLQEIMNMNYITQLLIVKLYGLANQNMCYFQMLLKFNMGKSGEQD